MITDCNAYTHDAIFYDDWNACVQSGDIPFFRTAARAYFDGKQIIELACGTGRILGAMADIIDRGVGIDLSEAMVDIARKKHADVQNITFEIGNMTDCAAASPADTVLCGYNSLQHLQEDADIDLFFRNCHRLLREDGVLIVDVFQPDARFLSVGGEYCMLGLFHSRTLGIPVEVSEYRKYNPDTQLNHLTTVYSYGEHSCKAAAVMRQFYNGTLERFAERNHFRVLHKYGDYSANPFDASSPKQICIFVKESHHEATIKTEL
jgi:ubiquinone/menaquinone biosynthesis C-methylase UbiE